MANAQFENISAVKKIDIAKMQTAQTIRINTKDEVKKVLSCGVDSLVNSYECMKGEASFFGRTNVRLLYIDENDTISSANYNADFTDRIAETHISPEAQMQFEVVVADYKTDTNQNVVTIQLVLEICASVFVVEGSPTLVGGENMFCRFTDIETTSEVVTHTINTDISEEMTATSNINRILLAESGVTVGDFAVDSGVLTLSGEAVVTLLYVSGEEIKSDRLPFKFATEIDAKHLSQTDQLDISAVVKNTKIRLDILEDELNNAFTADISLALQCSTTKTAQLSIVDDAYATDSDLTLNKNLLVTTLPCGSVSARRNIQQTVPFATSGEYVCTSNLSVIVSKCTSLEQQVSIEGILCGNVLYIGENGFDSMALELPFTEIVDIDYMMPNCRSVAHASVNDIAVKLGSTVTVDATVSFLVESCRDVSYSVIGEVTETPLAQTDSSAIEICMARKGETLWELAKGLHISEQDILTINPDIVSPLESDAKIVIYNAL